MNAADKGILMLTCRLGDPDAVTLSARQFHGLQRRLNRCLDFPREGELSAAHLCRIGLPTDTAQRIIDLLSRERQLDGYLEAAERLGIVPVTRLCPLYPRVLEQKLGNTAPPVLFFKGDLSLLEGPWVSLVGSRNLERKGKVFAERIGSLACTEGYVLVSGGASGADSIGQTACHERGGSVLVFTPERLCDQVPSERMLFCSEDGFELDFSSARALNRNRLIHAIGEKTFVAQCAFQRGGTWHGSVENLKNGYSPLYLMRDGSEGAKELIRLGGRELVDLETIRGLCEDQLSFENGE